MAPRPLNPLTPKISLVILFTIWHTIIKTNDPLIDIYFILITSMPDIVLIF